MYLFIRVVAVWLLAVTTAIAQESQRIHTLHDHSEQRKPGSQIRLHSRQRLAMAEGQTLTENIVLSTQGVSDAMTIDIQPSSGLALTGDQTRWVFDAPHSRQIDIPVELIATQNGRQFLHIFVEEDTPKAALSRTLAVVVDVGEAPPVSEHKKQTERSLPAQLFVKP